MIERPKDGWPLLLIGIVVVGLALLTLVVCAAVENDARIDVICDAHHMAGKEYHRLAGKTVLGMYMCVDESTGEVFDPDFMK